MSLQFESINIDRQAEYQALFDMCPQKTSDYSFVNLWGWAEEYGLQWVWSENLVWIKQLRPNSQFWAPIGPWDAVDWNEWGTEDIGEGTVFVRIPEILLGLWEKSRIRLTQVEMVHSI